MQGKIKGLAQNGLSPCLHIVFCGPPKNGRATDSALSPIAPSKSAGPRPATPQFPVIYSLFNTRDFWHDESLIVRSILLPEYER